MAGIFDGLASLGLGNLENTEIYEKEKVEEKVEEKEPEVHELDLIYEKASTCPICEEKIMAKTMKSGKAKLLGTDKDLRPKYEGIDIHKYNVVACPKCGYSCLTRFLQPLTEAQVKLVKENICSKVKLTPAKEGICTYEEALEYYKLALACAVVKKARVSEKAYICLHSGWLVRGMSEHLEKASPDYEAKMKEYKEMEEEYLKNALEGFLSARQTESYPICGMDEATIDYLSAVLAIRFHNLDVASRLVGGILTSLNANSRIKDKARDLKDEIMQELKAAKK